MSSVTGLVILDRNFGAIEQTVRCLISWCAEVIVIDMKSQMKANQLASDPKVRIHNILSPLPSPNAAIEIGRNLSSTNWIFLLYGSEIIRQPLADFVQQVILQDSTDVLYVPRMVYGFGYWLNGAGMWPDEQCRLFKKDKVSWSLHGIHQDESVRSAKIQVNELEGASEEVASARSIIEFRYGSASDLLAHLNESTDVSAQTLRRYGVPYNNHLHKSQSLLEYTTAYVNSPRGSLPVEIKEGLAIWRALAKWVEWFKVWELQSGHDQLQVERRYAEMAEHFDKLDNPGRDQTL